jgi:hypothetical protein
MINFMKLQKYFLTTLVGICTVSVALAADNSNYDSDYNTNPYYRSQEFSVDAFASGSLSEQGIKNLSGDRIRHDGRFGAGVGVNYFFCRYVGVGGEAYSEDTDRQFIDNASGNLILRYPIVQSGFAPYAFGGAGHEFDQVQQTFEQGGAGLEFRFLHDLGIFVDARYVFPERTENFALGRIGLRVNF